MSTIFQEHFAEAFAQRWENLKKALERPTRHVLLKNPFVASNSVSDVLQTCKRMDAPHCFCSLSIDSLYPPPTVDQESGLRNYYLLDYASVLPPLLLRPRPGERILDLCAAPGGKSLCIFFNVFATAYQAGMDSESTALPELVHTEIVSNEPSPARRSRLLNVLREYIPPAVLENHSRVTRNDGSLLFKREIETYHKVLVDAPCGSERHLLHQTRGAIGRDDWSISRSKRNASLQASLLYSAIKAVRPGGRVVYSTCSISDLENDGVVARILKKFESTIVLGSSLDEIEAMEIAGSIERTRYGWQILPDTSSWGPIYMSYFDKM